MHSFSLPFVILPVLVLQSYYHFNYKRQEEQSQKPVVVTFLHIGHPPDTDQRDEDEQGSGDDGAQEAEEAHDAECLKVFLRSHRCWLLLPPLTGIKAGVLQQSPQVWSSASSEFSCPDRQTESELF